MQEYVGLVWRKRVIHNSLNSNNNHRLGRCNLIDIVINCNSEADGVQNQGSQGGFVHPA